MKVKMLKTPKKSTKMGTQKAINKDKNKKIKYKNTKYFINLLFETYFLDLLNIFGKVMKKKLFFYYQNSIPYHWCVRKKLFYDSTSYQKKDISVCIRKNYSANF
jgi:hypothetical protein